MGSEGFFCVMGAIVEHAHIAQDLKKFPKEIGIVMHVNLHTKVNIYFILQFMYLLFQFLVELPEYFIPFISPTYL